MKKKWFTRGLALAMAAVICGGCGRDVPAEGTEESPAGQQTQQTKETPESPAAEGESSEEGYLVSETPIELSIFQFNGVPYDDDYAVFRRAEELTNVSLKGYMAKSVTDQAQAFNLMMSSNDIADIVCYSGKTNFDKYGADGAFLALNDLIEEHAPHIKAALEEHPNWKKFITALDGNIYYIPYIADGEINQVWFMRQDWLDKLELERPTTTEEFYHVLKAFKEQDPNGNGLADEIPLFSRYTTSAFNTMLPLWGANCWWYVDDADMVHYGPAEEAYKKAYIDLAKWYKEELIDQEIYTRGSTAISTLLSEDVGGCTHGYAGSTSQFNDTLANEIDGFRFLIIAPPGEKGSDARSDVSGNGWAISSSCKDPVAAIKYFDFWFTEEGRRLANFGLEGIHYDMVDGKPVFKEEVLNSEEAVVAQMNAVGAQIRIGVWQDFAYEEQWLTDIANEGIQLYTENNYCIYPRNTEFLYTEEEQRELSDLQAGISSYVDECAQKWVLGQGDPEAEFEGYLEKLSSMKLNRLMEIQQAAHDRYMAQ